MEFETISRKDINPNTNMDRNKNNDNARYMSVSYTINFENHISNFVTNKHDDNANEEHPDSTFLISVVKILWPYQLSV
jgi:hypothetical protein